MKKPDDIPGDAFPVRTDQQAFARFMDDYQDMVFSIALQLLRDRELAEEVAQDAFVKAYYAAGKFDGRSKVSTWLYRIAYNTSVSALRKRRQQAVACDVEASPWLARQTDTPYDEEKEARLNALSTVLGQLPGHESLIVTLYYYKELPVEEIAAITGLSASNVKVRLFRIRKKLYEQLKPYCHDAIG